MNSKHRNTDINLNSLINNKRRGLQEKATNTDSLLQTYNCDPLKQISDKTPEKHACKGGMVKSC